MGPALRMTDVGRPQLRLVTCVGGNISDDSKAVMSCTVGPAAFSNATREISMIHEVFLAGRESTPTKLRRLPRATVSGSLQRRGKRHPY